MDVIVECHFICVVVRCNVCSAAVKADAVGFVGLGNMGSYMAQNLLKKGYQVIAYDLSSDAVKTIVDAGEGSYNINISSLI